MTQDKTQLLNRIVAGMPSRFRSEKFPTLDAILQFRLTGEAPRNFHALISGGACAICEGMHENPTLTLKMSVETYLDMVLGKTTGQQAFFGQKLTYEGPISLVIKLSRLFEPLEQKA